LTSPTWWDRIKAWLHEKTRPSGEIPLAPTLTDDEVIAAWLDLPLKRYAGMDKARVWEMFVDWLAASEASRAAS